VVEELYCFTRIPGAIITEETFDAAVHFDKVRGDSLKRLLHDMTCLQAPPIALITYKEHNINDDDTKSMHFFIASITGWCLIGKERIG